MITEIVAVQTSEADKDINKVMFPMLRSLELERLPSLVSFCSVPLTAGQSTPLGLIDKKVKAGFNISSSLFCLFKPHRVP
jgi:hypothetical protein